MPLLFLKKLGFGFLALGSGYSGAIFVGSKDEEFRTLFEEYIPGYRRSVVGFNNLRVTLEDWSRKLTSKGIGRNDQTSNKVIVSERNQLLHTVSELQSKLEQERHSSSKVITPDEVWKLKYEEEKNEKLQIVDKFNIELENAVKSYLLNVKEEIRQGIDKAITEERNKNLKNLEDLIHRIDILNSECILVKKKFIDVATTESMLSVVAQIEMLQTERFGSDIEAIKLRLVELQSKMNGDEFGLSLCSSLLRNDICYSVKDFRQKVETALPFVEAYSSWLNSWWAIFPTSGIFKKSAESANEVESQANALLKESLCYLNQGNFIRAVSTMNSIKGWPRIAMIDLITSTRQLVEFRQGLHVLKAYLLLRQCNIL